MPEDEPYELPSGVPALSPARHTEAVALFLLSQGVDSPLPATVAGLRFLLLRLRIDRMDDPEVLPSEQVVTCEDLSFAAFNPLLHDLPVSIVTAMLSEGNQRKPASRALMLAGIKAIGSNAPELLTTILVLCLFRAGVTGS